MNGKAINMANELEVQRVQQLSVQRSLSDLTNQLTLADHLVYKKYLAELQNYGMVELSQQMLEVQNPARCIRMFQLKELTLKKGEDMFQKLSTVYYSSMAQGCSLAAVSYTHLRAHETDSYLVCRLLLEKKKLEKKKKQPVSYTQLKQ